MVGGVVGDHAYPHEAVLNDLIRDNVVVGVAFTFGGEEKHGLQVNPLHRWDARLVAQSPDGITPFVLDALTFRPVAGLPRIEGRR